MIGNLGTILKWAILLPILLALVLLAVANDQSVPVHLNPFNTDDPVLRFDLALYQIAFIFFALGVLAGGLVAWLGQRKYRSRSRQRRNEAAFWQAKAETSERRSADQRPSQATAFLPRPERS